MKKEEEIKIKQIDSSANPIGGKTYALVLTITILIIGTFFYFNAVNNAAEMPIKSQKSTDTDSQEQMASNANSIIENNPEASVNTGSEKSMNNKDSSEIKTQNSNSLFNHILQENRIFTKENPEGFIKLFYYYTGDEPIDIQLKEGDIKDYKIHMIGGQYYYPLILGYEEAKTMREEGLFNNIGDPIKNFYGKNVVVVGIMKKSDNAFDMIYIVPLTSGGLN